MRVPIRAHHWPGSLNVPVVVQHILCHRRLVCLAEKLRQGLPCPQYSRVTRAEVREAGALKDGEHCRPVFQSPSHLLLRYASFHSLISHLWRFSARHPGPTGLTMCGDCNTMYYLSCAKLGGGGMPAADKRGTQVVQVRFCSWCSLPWHGLDP